MNAKTCLRFRYFGCLLRLFFHALRMFLTKLRMSSAFAHNKHIRNAHPPFSGAEVLLVSYSSAEPSPSSEFGSREKYCKNMIALLGAVNNKRGVIRHREVNTRQWELYLLKYIRTCWEDIKLFSELSLLQLKSTPYFLMWHRQPLWELNHEEIPDASCLEILQILVQNIVSLGRVYLRRLARNPRCS